MILLIDIGNTNTVYSLYNGNDYVVNKRIAPDKNINCIINDLIDTYKATPCAGIAANQIGYQYQILIGMKELENLEDAKEIEKAEAE